MNRIFKPNSLILDSLENTPVQNRKGRSNSHDMNNQVFVARHKALYQYCLERSIINQDTPAYFKRVAIRDIKGKDVVGVLSLEMASYANTYTEIPLHGCHVEPGLELDIEDIRMGAGEPRTYEIKRTK